MKRLIIKLLACASLLAALPVSSQTAAGLYDPEPPANSSYLRLIHAAHDGMIDVLVDGKLRIKQLGPGQASDYLVLPAGQHKISLSLKGKTLSELPFDCVGTHAYSLAYTSLKADAKPMVFEDKTIANKLKATLTAYHLQNPGPSFDVMTADGKLTVFPGLAAGSHAVRAVNPINVELVANSGGNKLAQTKVEMLQGGSYSVLFIGDSQGKLQAHTLQNKIERYTGK